MDAGGKRTSSGFTDTLVEQADAAQYQLGEGPCITAWAIERMVIIDDLHTDPRWHAWRSAMATLPLRWVVSTPLIAGKESIGALKIYSALSGQYDDNSGRVLSLFAGAAATLLAHIQGSEAPLQTTENLRAALIGRDTVNRACGVLMERQGISQDRAMRQLIENARVTGTPLVEISEQLITKAPPPAAR